ncbi:serine/threonine protein phosphatase [Ensifer adhaerens]|uniref:metallophosphoesterase family protein n=1 Tax=Ensifer adhaerens TaxID=106592 RepID=UPI001CBADE3D|nr:metallophosphoesterase family protein [Ensifer adhaerens]MBZ7925484.1 serine/threonine protein phosphatase [Ensifer adhaerens]UAX95357.1 serine/threonine protein phosphatase [Ensifer adhaerens]UAY02751.1 serine/threonine protein phosphatase [Ensifer adhaerens]UAY10735.1 serine/threonine protein phosphatase [Ensifer adhaerens]
MAVRQLTFAIGDIHGCLDQLRVLLHEIEAYAPAGRVIFLGDLIDRGPESRGVVELVMAGPSKPGWTWLTLKGNHEEMLWGASRGESDVDWWLMNGGQETLVSYNGVVPGRHLKWIKELPTILVERYRIFVHAGIDETLPLEQQGDEIFLWIRRPDDYSGDYWGKHLCHGHTPSLANPRTVGNRTNVDSGAVFGGVLSCAVFDDDQPGGPIDFLMATQIQAAS